MRSNYRGATQRIRISQAQYNQMQQYPQAFHRAHGRGYQPYYGPSYGQGFRSDSAYQQPRNQPTFSLNRPVSLPPQRSQITATPSNEPGPQPRVPNTGLTQADYLRNSS